MIILGTMLKGDFFVNKQSLNRPYQRPSFQEKKTTNIRKNTSNTGNAFENLVLYSNNLYFLQDMAFIQKLEQPVLITKKYPDGTVTGKLKKSTVDFLGSTNQGKMVAFDAKSNSSKTSFPLNNVEQHQFEILEKYHCMNAFSFLLVEWTAHDEYYVLPFPLFKAYWNEGKKDGRKSIPYQVFVTECIKVEKGKRGIALDYLAPLGVT